jgi:uncharacterized protein YfaS (alpha-2-macroglobulin family)
MKHWKLLPTLVISLMITTTAWAEFYASKVAQGSYDNSPAIVIRLTDALDISVNLEDYVSVMPVITNGSKWITIDGGYSWTLPFVEPNTTYQIEFTDYPTSANNETFSRVEIGKSNQKNQYSDFWEVTTAALTPSAAFASNGQYLATNAERALPVTVVNVEELELDVFRIKDDQQENFLSQKFYSGRLYYSELTNLKQWADLVHTARYTFDIRQHKRETVNLDITPATKNHDTGIYVAVMRKPGVYEYRYDTTFFTQSDIGLHARMMSGEVQAITHSISTGEALENVEVTFLWSQNGTRDLRSRQATTNELGITSKLATNMPSLIIAKNDKQISFLNPQHNRLDLSAFQNVPERHQDIQAFLYGPRDLYRPGETVNINMLLRDYDGRELETMPVKAELRDSRGSKIESFTWWAESSGVFLHQLTLDTNAPTGEWSFTVNPGQENSSRYTFMVEEFLPERLSMTFYDGTLEQYRYLEKRNGTVPINGQYLYGAPAAGNKADAVVTVASATDLFEQWEDFRFGNPTERIVQTTRTLDAIILDENGDGELQLPTIWQDINTPLNIRVTASVYETGGRPVTRSQSVISLPEGNQRFIGVRPQFEERPKSNQSVKFDLVSVDRQGVAEADIVDVKLIRKTRDYYWFYDDSNGWNWRWRADAYVAFSKVMDVGLEPTSIELPLQWGDYELEVTSSRGTKTVYPFRTQYSWANQSSNALKPEVIDIILDKDAYVPGERIQLTYQSANAGQGLLQIESSEKVIYSQFIEAKSGKNTLTLPMNSDWNRHDLYLTLMVLSPADQISDVAPKRSLGISHLPVLREKSTLKATLSAPEKIEPNQSVTAQINIENPEDAQGSPIYATVALVDKGVLNITNFKRPQPEKYFFAQRRFENSYLDLYGKVINNLGFKTYQQRFGGGFADSDDALSRGGDQPQSEVQIISFLSDPIEVINGQAEVTFELPSFNGRVKWMVVAWSADAFGSDEQEMTVADKLVTQLSMPRFLAMGDESQLTLDLHNLSGEAQDLSVDVNINGSISSPIKPQTIKLDDKQKQNIVIPITAVDYQGIGTISMRVTNGSDISLAREWKLGVRAPYPLTTRQIRKVIDPNESWAPNIKTDNLINSTTKAQLTLSDKPAINFNAHLDYLLRYPYGCLEQTTSSTYPWVLIDSGLFESLELETVFSNRFEGAFTDQFRRQQIESGLDRLYKKQKQDGTFGYWGANSSASFWGTAYATELLVDARELGIPVDDGRLNKALDALSRLMNAQSTNDIWTDDIGSYQASYRAYGAYVLAKANKTNISNLRRVYDQLTKASISHSSLPWMHLASAFKLSGDQNRANLAVAQATKIQRAPNRYYADYGSTLRDTSLSLALALEYQLDQGTFASQMEDSLANRRWLSTQERLSLLRVAKAFMKDGKTWQAELMTSAFSQTIKQETPFNSVISGSDLDSIESIKAEDRRVYANVLWQGVPANTPEAYQHGMSIYRNFYDLKGNEIDLSAPIESGDLIIVRIDVKSLEYRFPEALVVDLLPAGFELENQNLLNASVDLDSITIDQMNIGEYFRSYRVEYEEYRDDRYVSTVSLVPWSPTTLFYLARAVTPGIYAMPNSYIEDMYRPENQALGSSPGIITIIGQ